MTKALGAGLGVLFLVVFFPNQAFAVIGFMLAAALLFCLLALLVMAMTWTLKHTWPIWAYFLWKRRPHN